MKRSIVFYTSIVFAVSSCIAMDWSVEGQGYYSDDEGGGGSGGGNGGGGGGGGTGGSGGTGGGSGGGTGGGGGDGGGGGGGDGGGGGGSSAGTGALVGAWFDIDNSGTTGFSVAANASNPAITISADGEVYVAWVEQVDVSNTDIMVFYYDPGNPTLGWQERGQEGQGANATNTTGPSSQPAIAAPLYGGDGPVLAWVERIDAGNSEIYLRLWQYDQNWYTVTPASGAPNSDAGGGVSNTASTMSEEPVLLPYWRDSANEAYVIAWQEPAGLIPNIVRPNNTMINWSGYNIDGSGKHPSVSWGLGNDSYEEETFIAAYQDTYNVSSTDYDVIHVTDADGDISSWTYIDSTASPRSNAGWGVGNPGKNAVRPKIAAFTPTSDGTTYDDQPMIAWREEQTGGEFIIVVKQYDGDVVDVNARWPEVDLPSAIVASEVDIKKTQSHTVLTWESTGDPTQIHLLAHNGSTWTALSSSDAGPGLSNSVAGKNAHSHAVAVGPSPASPLMDTAACVVFVQETGGNDAVFVRCHNLP